MFAVCPNPVASISSISWMKAAMAASILVLADPSPFWSPTFDPLKLFAMLPDTSITKARFRVFEETAPFPTKPRTVVVGPVAVSGSSIVRKMSPRPRRVWGPRPC